MRKLFMNKVVWFFPSVGKLGGAERRLSRIAEGLRKEEFVKSKILIKKIGDFDKAALVKEYRKILNSDIEIFIAETNLQVVLFLKRTKPDWVCYTDSYIRGIPAILGGLLAKSKLLMLNVTTFASSYQEKSRIKRIIYSSIVQISSVLDVLYPTSYNILKKKFPKKNIMLTPGSFTDMQKFISCEKKEKFIVFSGRLIREKDPLLLIKAVGLCSEKLRAEKYKVLICGNGYLKEEIISKIEEYSITDIVEMKGNCDMSNILPKTKIFCSLQYYNNYPSQALLEALASGCYCIVTSDGDSLQMITEECGKLVNHCEEELSKTIELALEFDDAKWDKVRINAREHCEAKFSLDNSVAHYNGIFNGR